MRILFHFLIFFIFGYFLREKPQQPTVYNTEPTSLAPSSAADTRPSLPDSDQPAMDSMAVASRQPTAIAR